MSEKKVKKIKFYINEKLIKNRTEKGAFVWLPKSSGMVGYSTFVHDNCMSDGKIEGTILLEFPNYFNFKLSKSEFDEESEKWKVIDQKEVTAKELSKYYESNQSDS